MKSVIFLLVCFCFSALQSFSQSSFGANPVERKVLKCISDLPEVVKENNRRKNQHIDRYLKAYIQKLPTGKDKYYMVTVSEENHERLFTYDWYKVYTGTYEIKHYDMIEGETLSLSDWRRKRKQHQ